MSGIIDQGNAQAPASSREEPRRDWLEIKSIVRDARYQIRRKMDQATVDRYANLYRNGTELPPVQVVQIGEGLVLVDGWHRVAAREVLGKPEVLAEISEGTEREARWLAAKANLAHGLPLKKSEIKDVFRAYIKARQHRGRDGKLKAYREIASEIGGVAFTTVRNWMMKLYPQIAEQMGRDGFLEGTGGLRHADPQAPFERVIRESLDRSRAAYQGITDPRTRGDLILLVEDLLVSMKSEHHVEPDF